MAGMKPVIVSRDDNFFATGRGRHRRRFGKTFQLVCRKNAIGDIFSGNKFFAGVIRHGFAVRPKVGLQTFEQRVETGRAVGFNDFVNVTDGVQKIPTLGQREFWRMAGELLQHGIRPEQHGKFAELRRLFKETQVARLDIIKSTADDDLFLRGHFQDWIFSANAIWPSNFSGSEMCRPFSSRVNFNLLHQLFPTSRTLPILPGHWDEPDARDLTVTLPSLGRSSTMA